VVNEKVIFAGFGGQGVMSMGKLITYAGMLEGKQVSWLPSYGPEMRGGTANCNVIVSDHQIGSPVISRDATALVAMNTPSLDKFEGDVNAGGCLLVNSSLVDRTGSRKDISVYCVPANEIALKMNNLKVANMVALGAYIEIARPVEMESVVEALKKVFGKSKSHLLEVNKEALARGAQAVRKASCE
jgi:2-oxoglutarate ferredoxin oxidoreductase subunit gamma